MNDTKDEEVIRTEEPAWARDARKAGEWWQANSCRYTSGGVSTNRSGRGGIDVGRDAFAAGREQMRAEMEVGHDKQLRGADSAIEDARRQLVEVNEAHGEARSRAAALEVALEKCCEAVEAVGPWSEDESDARVCEHCGGASEECVLLETHKPDCEFGHARSLLDTGGPTE